MKTWFKEHKFLFALLVLLAAYYFGTLHTVPFHPDESTQIYMSRDVNHILSDPLQMAWLPGQPLSPETRLRKLDAPLTRYLIGIGRTLSGTKGVEKNWDWAKTWKENRRQGAFPDARTLWISRASITLLLPISLVFFYYFLTHISHKYTALFGVLLLGLHPLVLLHGRRAMAEGLILFGVCFFLFTLLFRKQHPWLVGLAFGLAFNAKQSTLALLPAGIIAVSWIPKIRQNFAKLIKNTLQFLGATILVTYLLNPILWKAPLRCMYESWQTRLAFTAQQISTISAQAPHRILDGFPQRMLSLVNNLYLNQPSIADVGNYLAHTQQAADSYLNLPFTSLGRGLIWGSILLTLTIIGLIYVIASFSSFKRSTKRSLILLVVSSVSQAAALLIAVPLTWQRYVIPVLPYVIISISLSLLPFQTHFLKLLTQDADASGE